MLMKLGEPLATLMARLLLVLAAGLCGCAGPAPKSIADWHDAVVAVREQSATTFRGVNDLVREAQVKRAATLQNLKESDFHPGLEAESIGLWNHTLDDLAAYSLALSTLLSPQLAAGIGDSTKQLGHRSLLRRTATYSRSNRAWSPRWASWERSSRRCQRGKTPRQSWRRRTRS